MVWRAGTATVARPTVRPPYGSVPATRIELVHAVPSDVQLEPRRGRSLTAFWSANPELVEQHAPHWVELEVPDSFRDEVEFLTARVGNPGCCVDEFLVDVRPLLVCPTGICGLERLRLAHLNVESWIAESRVVRLSAAAERGLDDRRRRGVVGVTTDQRNLHVPA